MVYLPNLFWAAYWFLCASSFLVRLLHRWVWIPHALWVDDGLLLLPADVAPLVATTSLMFFLSIGVSISWGKIEAALRWQLFARSSKWAGESFPKSRNANLHQKPWHRQSTAVSGPGF
jgi:hypothetical protein